MIQFIVEHKAVFLGALLALSEALALIPSVEANSIFQLVVKGIKGLLGK